MECLCAIGIGIVGKIAEYTVEPVGRQVGYVFNYNKNLNKLQTQVNQLDAARESLEHKVFEEERTGRKIETIVSNWLRDVTKITGVARNFLKYEHRAKIKCLNGFCPNLMARHHLSRKSTKLVQDVADLYGKKDFSNIAYDIIPEEVCVESTKDYEAFDSRTSLAKQIMDELRDSDTDMIGVYGIGGVGKTTLVKEVYRRVTKDKTLFDDVVMVLDLKRNPSIARIQNEIAEKLGLKLDKSESLAGRARNLCNRIKDKKTLVILDDVWGNIDLEAVGLPRKSTLKILLSSRSKLVLSASMGTQKEFPLRVLDREESWSLFKKTAGNIVENSDIQIVATQVAEKCGGLPLLTVTVARFLRNRGLHAWKDTLRRLKQFDGQGLTEKTYSAIEWSYSSLEDVELKSLFMLCGVVVGTANTYLIADLWKYSMGLGLLKNVATIGEAWDALCSMIEQLKDSCLLQESGDNKRVRMHDLVKDVAKRIASKEKHVLSLSSGSELKKWPNEDFCSKCTMISLNLCKIPELPEVLPCQELAMFLLHTTTDDSSREIPCNFFQELKKLRVLDLTELSIPSLPSSLGFLESLRTLCLDQCTLGDIALVGQLENLEILSFVKSKFKELPKEIGKLRRLQLLDLAHCSQLEVISPHVLSSLKRLEHLRMRNSFNQWEAGGVNSLERSNASLEELKNLPLLTELQLHIPNPNILPPDLFTGSKLEKFQICIGSTWKWDDVDEANTALKLQLTCRNQLDQGLVLLLKRTEDLYLEGMEGVYSSLVHQLGVEGFPKLKHLHVQNNAEFTNFTCIINGKIGYANLTWLAVNELNGIRFLLTSPVARSLAQLRSLQISGCQIMEEIISIEESDEQIIESFFCQLQDLELKGLPNLTKLCSRSYVEVSNSRERLQSKDCTKSSRTSCEEIDTERILDSVTQHFLFDTKVEFPNLKKLSIEGLAKLTTIWNNNLPLEGSKNLEMLEVVSCVNLKSIFPASLAKTLPRLSKLMVKECGVEEIIAPQWKSFSKVSAQCEQQTQPNFNFLKVTGAAFIDLPKLRCFYPAVHASSWPALHSLEVVGCHKLKFLSELGFQGKCETNISTPLKQTLFSVEKDSFPNLEHLSLCSMKIWDGPLPANWFRKLKSLTVCCSQSVGFLDKLVDEGNSSTSTKENDGAAEIGTLPNLTELELCPMPNLIHLGENSQSSPRIPNFQDLEIVLVNSCQRLRNLQSSAICFNNLTTL